MMKDYCGTKALSAMPMSLGEYNLYRGWNLPKDEDPERAGYLVEYRDGGGANHPNHDGYISWSPKDVFEASYQPVDAMSFGHALVAMKAGHRVARAGWNGKGMWLFDWNYSERSATTHHESAPFIAMKTVDDVMVPWLASQTDMLADDWMILQGD